MKETVLSNKRITDRAKRLLEKRESCRADEDWQELLAYAKDAVKNSLNMFL